MLISLVVGLIILGLLFWLVSFLPLPSPFPEIIRVVFVIVAIIYVLNAFSFIHTGLTI